MATSPAAAWARTAASSLAPPRVRLATTSISFTAVLSSRARGVIDARGAAAGGGGCGRGGGGEDPVDGTRDAVLVRSADDGGHAVEVEDRRRRGDLPLQGHAPPGVGDRTRATAPAGDHVVEEDQRAE